MKSYAIYDANLNRITPIGYMFYYEKAEEFVIELCEDLDEWDVPLLFQGLVRQGIYTVSKEYSLLWVKERVIPSGRQNIGMLLRNHHLKKYSEMAFLALSKGKCSQDSCYLEEIPEEKISESILNRRNNNVQECFVTGDNQLICMFRDNTVRKVDLTKLVDQHKDVTHVINNKEMLRSASVGVGGYSVLFNGTIEIPTSELRKVGVLLPLTTDDFYEFVRTNVIDTTESCDRIQCSRQNLSYMVKEGKIQPIIRGTKENLFLKGEIERIMQE
ncbi:MAG: hypothetical protein ACI4D0_05790 [Lachnospira sp.]